MTCPLCGRQPGQCDHTLDLEERRAVEAVASGYRHWRYDQPQIEAPWEADDRVRLPWEKAVRGNGMSVYDALEGFGGLLRCETCRWTQPIGPGDASHNLRHGWPKCCGYTMRWWTQRQLDAGEMTS